MSTQIVRSGHEIANIMPLMAAEEFDGLKRSIERNGVLEPVVTFGGKILDGRHRRRAVDELNAEGKTMVRDVVNPESGEKSSEPFPYECPAVEFTGTEQEALEYAVSRGLNRRQLNSSQKAVVAVRAMLLGKTYAKRANKVGESVLPINEELLNLKPEGDFASWIAKVGGTNRTYVFRALKLASADGGEAHLKKIMAGEESINAALAALAAEGGVEEPGEVEVPIVLDGEGNAVDEKFFPAFSEREEFKTVDQKLREILTYVENLCGGPGGAWLYQSELLGLVRSLRKSLKDGQPHVVCPGCHGSGNQSEGRSACKVCKRSKYVTKAILEAFSSSSNVSEEEVAAEVEVAS